MEANNTSIDGLIMPTNALPTTDPSSAYYKRSSFSLLSVLPFYIPITLLCLVGNTLVCITIFRNPRMRKRCYYILMNLAIADMGFALATPLQLLQFSNINPGTVGCKLCIFTVDIFFGSAVLSLAAVSIDRYRGICLSKLVRDEEGMRLGNFMIPLIWIAAGVVYIPMLVACREDPDPNKISCDCHSIWPEKYQYTIYAFFVVLCTYILPLVTMVYCYTHILLTIQKSKNEAPTSSGGAENKKKVIKMLIAATTLFMLCWLLYNILYLLKKFNAVSGKLLGKLWLFSQVLGFANSAANPFIYCIFSKNFRRGFKDVFLCRRRGVLYSSHNNKGDSPLSQERIVKPRSNTAKSVLDSGCINSDDEDRKPRCSTDKSTVDTGYHSNEEDSVKL